MQADCRTREQLFFDNFTLYYKFVIFALALYFEQKERLENFAEGNAKRTKQLIGELNEE
ncbi:hypothetical protein V7150_14240 [Neobacillus drentensis]|uniref:hypothetical protein n=1 Tax=Neobacillus drentensis TaxID=220684 RepID=UPI002FFFD856